jgi:hypothetical protein
MNEFVLDSQFVEEKRFYMYEDRFIPILERIFKQNWVDEAERLIEEENTHKK